MVIVQESGTPQQAVERMGATTGGIAQIFPKVSAKKTAEATLGLNDIPLIVGGRSSGRGAFTGQASYERTEAQSIPSQVGQVLGVKDNQITIPKEILSTKDVQILSTPSRSEQAPRQDVFERIDEQLTQRQRDEQRQRDRQRQEPRMTQFFRTLRPVEPRVRIPTPSVSSSGVSKARPNLLSKVRKAYDVIVFKRGKEVTIGRNLPEGRAKQLGTTNVLRTLRASFKLKPRGSTSQEDIDFNVPSNVFRPSKRDANRFVQRRNLRLGSTSEISEIIKIPKTKGRRKFKWF